MLAAFPTPNIANPVPTVPKITEISHENLTDNIPIVATNINLEILTVTGISIRPVP